MMIPSLSGALAIVTYQRLTCPCILVLHNTELGADFAQPEGGQG